MDAHAGGDGNVARREALLLLPLFLLYLAIAAAGWRRAPDHDEPRYLRFAENLTHGFYSPADRPAQLWNAPGYPLLLAPFRALGFGPGALRMLNAPLLLAAVWCFFRFLGNFLDRRAARLGAWALGFYFPLWKSLPALMSEVLAVFLVCALLWAWSELLRRDRLSGRWLAAAGIAFAWLALTRAIFGYVLFGCLLVHLVCAAGARGRVSRRMLLAHAFAAILCVPWLSYTYALTGKAFAWSTAGGMSLYWMTNSAPDEWGDWRGFEDVASDEALAAHRPFFDRLGALDEVRQDEAFKAAAWRNLRDDPAAYLRNVAANLSRLFFSFPYSHTPQKLSGLFYALPNSFLLAFGCLAVVRLARAGRREAAALFPFLLFAGAGLAATSLLSAYPRMLFPFVPVILFLILRERRPDADGLRENS